MKHRINIIRSIAAGVFIGFVGCGQSNPPPVVTATLEVDADSAKEKPVAPVNGPMAAKNDPIPDGGTFPFPTDAGGKALAKTLAPAKPAAMPAGAAAEPKARRLPSFVDSPAPSPSDSDRSLPRLELHPSKDARPVPLPDRVPNDIGGLLPQLPSRGEIPTGPLTRTVGRDVHSPLELPILSPRPVADRAPLADPTLDFTAKSVISPSLPLRTEATGFIRINLPDPFEHSEAARPRTPVVDDPNRSLGIPPPPRQ
jgi:hypothetical protein